MFNFKSKKLSAGAGAIGLNGLVESLESHINGTGITGKGKQIGEYMLAQEGLSESASNELRSVADDLATALESINAETSLGLGTASAHQMEAGVIAGMMAGNIKKYLAHPVTQAMAADKNTSVVSMESLVTQGDMFDKRVPAFEAYDETDNRNAVVYSIAYNMNASRQNEFGEAFFPTIVVSPDNVGYDISVRLFTIFDGDLKRDVDGSINDFRKKNIIRANIDHTLLQNNLTQIVPVHSVATAATFVATGDVAPRDVLVGRETVRTSALAVGKRYSLLGLSSTPALIANGLQDVSDSISPAIKLANVYVKVGTGATADVLKLDVSGFFQADFTAPVQGQHRQMNLSFTPVSILLNKLTKRADGSALQHLADVVTDDVIVYLGLNMTGTANLETATTEVFGNRVSVEQVKSNTGEGLSLTSGTGGDIATLLANATIIGYDLLAYRTNSNRRQRGDLLDTQYWNQRYQVPLHGPVSVIRPVNSDGQTDTSDLSALITTTQIRASNNAVTQLLATASMLEQHVDNRDGALELPDLFGVGRYLIKPVFYKETLEMPTSLDSLKSSERAKDVQANIINKLRDLVYRMYVESGFKAAADAYQGGSSATPTVILGCDQELARYLQVDGDLRTIGPDFDVKVVSSLDKRMSGKIAVAFGFFKGDGNTPNALHFGNMLWKPELTLVLPITRGGSTSKELTVQPSFLHIVNCPVMSLLEVNGIRDVIASKVNVHMEIQ